MKLKSIEHAIGKIIKSVNMHVDEKSLVLKFTDGSLITIGATGRDDPELYIYQDEDYQDD